MKLVDTLIDTISEIEDLYKQSGAKKPKYESWIKSLKAIVEFTTGKTWEELTEPDIPTAAIEIGETVTCPQCKTMRFTPCIDPGDEFTCTNCGIVFKAGKTIRNAKEKPALTTF